MAFLPTTVIQLPDDKYNVYVLQSGHPEQYLLVKENEYSVLTRRVDREEILLEFGYEAIPALDYLEGVDNELDS